MSEIWLTSDEHYFHDNNRGGVIEMCGRPFKDLREMTETFIQNHNKLVSKGDRTYHLGDFSFGKKEETQEVLSQLNGQHYLIIGNHCSKHIQDLDWVWARQKSGLKVNKNEYIHLDHYPHMSWNRSYHGSRHSFGHIHSKGGDYWCCQNSCDVGVDYWGYKPVNAIEFINHLDRINNQAIGGGYFMWRGGPFQETFDIFYINQIQIHQDRDN